jgi:hypothetical protein
LFGVRHYCCFVVLHQTFENDSMFTKF